LCRIANARRAHVRCLTRACEAGYQRRDDSLGASIGLVRRTGSDLRICCGLRSAGRAASRRREPSPMKECGPDGVIDDMEDNNNQIT
jgi:hypothetical protein